MSTYSYSATRGSDLDKARELLGGCDVSTPEAALRSDEDMQAIIDREGFVRGVAWLASGLYAEFARQPTRITASGKTIDYANLLAGWDALASPLRTYLAAQGERPPPPRQPQVGQIVAGTATGNKIR